MFSRILTCVTRVVAGVLTIAFLAYGMLLAADAPAILGVNSKSHGLVIISLGLLMGRYAATGKTGLPALDEGMRSADEER